MAILHAVSLEKLDKLTQKSGTVKKEMAMDGKHDEEMASQKKVNKKNNGPW